MYNNKTFPSHLVTLAYKHGLKHFTCCGSKGSSDLFDGRLEVKDTQLEDVNQIVGLQSLEVWVFLQLREALAANTLDTLL